ncbi:hypothetical protein ACKVEX_00220 [Rhodocyclaceae bacterium SMB388]
MNKIIAGMMAGLAATGVLSVLMSIKRMMGAGLFGLQMPSGVVMVPVGTPMPYAIFGIAPGQSLGRVAAP